MLRKTIQLYMKWIFILTTLLWCSVIFFDRTNVFSYSYDVSNEPPSSYAEFIRLKKDDSRSHTSLSLSDEDYNNIIDFPFQFIQLPLVCQESPTFLLILVHSAPRHFKERITIRDTWGVKNKQEVKLLFLLGSEPTENKTFDSKLKNESQIFGDIVMGSFIDSYKNLTYKHTMALKYAVYHCSTAKYILKTDDDIFVDTPSLLNYIETNISPYGAEKLLMCNVWSNAIVVRSYKSKYRLSFREFPHRRFPRYCSGWFVLYSFDVALDLYLSVQNSTYVWIDDAFITGILADKLKIPHFNIVNWVISANAMNKIAEGKCDEVREKFILGRPNIKSNIIRALWRCVQRTNYFYGFSLLGVLSN